MSLDITILDTDDTPLKSVSLGVDLHYSLMQMVSGLSLDLMTRMSDYYLDADYSVSELPSLQMEIEKLEGCLEESETIELVSKIKRLVSEAISGSKRVSAIAD